MSIPEFSLTRILSSVGRVERNVVIIPPVPLLLPDLGGERGAAPVIRSACRRAVQQAWLSATSTETASQAGLPEIAVVAPARDSEYTALTGSLKAWGSGEVVSGGNYLSELLARWLVDYALAGSAENAPNVDVFGTVKEAIGSGAPVVLVMADGPSGLTEHSPHALVSGAAAVNDWCRSIAIAAVDPFAQTVTRSSTDNAIAQIEAVTESTNWQAAPQWRELEKLSQTVAPEKTAYFDESPFGIGYHVARWSWREANS